LYYIDALVTIVMTCQILRLHVKELFAIYEL